MSQIAPVVGAHSSNDAAIAQTAYTLYLVGLIFPLMPIIVLITALTLPPILGWIILAYALAPIIGSSACTPRGTPRRPGCKAITGYRAARSGSGCFTASSRR